MLHRLTALVILVFGCHPTSVAASVMAALPLHATTVPVAPLNASTSMVARCPAKTSPLRRANLCMPLYHLYGSWIGQFAYYYDSASIQYIVNQTNQTANWIHLLL
jgi:hypothetical protein